MPTLMIDEAEISGLSVPGLWLVKPNFLLAMLIGQGGNGTFRWSVQWVWLVKPKLVIDEAGAFAKIDDWSV